MLFELQPQKAILNDLNSELMNMYSVVQNHTNELIEKLEEYAINDSKNFYYKLRAKDRSEKQELNNIEKAARTIYLNKTCYNGLYRVNKNNQFNVPYGAYKNRSIFKEQNIRNMEKYFKNNEIIIYNRDYKDVLKLAKSGDFVYLDPPYDETWTDYTTKGFNKQQQEELAKACNKLHVNGIRFVLSNNHTPFIEHLYKDFNIKIVKANRCINRDKNKRGKVEELLVYNFFE